MEEPLSPPKATAPKVEAKAETKSDSEHFSYDDYGKLYDKIEAAEKEIDEEFDKKYEEERAEKMKRFDELDAKDDTDRSD